MTSSVRTYGGIPVAERRRSRRAQLLEAALDEVGSSGVAAVTVEGVCARAGLTKRYFYESFPDREGLLVAAVEEMFGAIWSDVVAAADAHPTGVGARARAAVDALADGLLADRRRARLYVECPAVPVLGRHKEAAIARFTALAAERLLPFAPDFPAAERALAARMVVAGATDLMTAWLAGELVAGRAEMTTAIMRTALAGCATPLQAGESADRT